MTRNGALDLPSGAPSRPARHRGRPRDEHVDEAVLQATIDLLMEVGLHGTTTAAVAKRAGVARATVYLRWPSHEALIAAANRQAMRREPFPLSGDLAEDIRGGSRFISEVFAEPGFVAILPELMRAVLSRPASADFDTLAPNRKGLAGEYEREAAGQGFRTDVEPELLFDLLFGAHVSRILATGTPAPLAAADAIAEAVIAGLRDPGFDPEAPRDPLANRREANRPAAAGRRS